MSHHVRQSTVNPLCLTELASLGSNTAFSWRRHSCPGLSFTPSLSQICVVRVDRTRYKVNSRNGGEREVTSMSHLGAPGQDERQGGMGKHREC